MADKIMLLDGHSLLNRAFYGLPDLTNAEESIRMRFLAFKYHASLCRRGEANASSCGI